MRNLLVLLIFLISNFSIASNDITITGKILNKTKDKFIITGQNFTQEVEINQNGEFKATFELKYVGIYTLFYDNYDIKLYLTKGDNIIFNADENEFLKSLEFKGRLAIENNYLIKKQLTTSKNIISEEYLYKLNESDFLEKLKLWKLEILKLYNSTKFKDLYFKSHEIKNIAYTETYFLKIFSSFNKTEDGKSKLSNKFPMASFILDYQNTEDYCFSEAYTTITDSEYFIHIENLHRDNKQIPKLKIQIEEVKKIGNEVMKNGILGSLVNKISLSNPDFEYLYNELMQIIKDENWKNEVKEKYNTVKKLVKGSPSPTFNYENYNGSFTTLESLKGKYVFIDVWATWCGPCLMEVPNLEKLQDRFKDKNIAFVSISVDKKTDKHKWKKMIEEKKLGGIQLITDSERNSDFLKKYVVGSIPRFILLDTEGKIIDADAPRPSNPKLVEILNNLP